MPAAWVQPAMDPVLIQYRAKVVLQKMMQATRCVQAPVVVPGEAEEEIQRALYVGNTSAAVDAALQVGHMPTLGCHPCYELRCVPRGA